MLEAELRRHHENASGNERRALERTIRAGGGPDITRSGTERTRRDGSGRVGEVRMVQGVVSLSSEFKCILLLDEELLGELRIDIKVTGAAENAGTGLAEVHLNRGADARGRVVSLELAGRETRRVAAAMDSRANRLDMRIDDSGQRSRAGSTAGIDLSGDLAVGRREGRSRVDIELHPEGPAAQHRSGDGVGELVGFVPDEIADDGMPHVESLVAVAEVEVVGIVDRGKPESVGPDPADLALEAPLHGMAELDRHR